MPTIPRRRNTELQTAPLPGQKQGTTPGLGSFGGGEPAAQVYQAGRELLKTGVDIFKEEKRKADEVLVRDVDLDLSQEETRIGIALKNMKGRAAAGAVDFAAVEWDNATRKALSQATNEEQAANIKKISAQRYATLNRSAQIHTDTALKEHDDTMAAQHMKSLDEQSALNYDNTEIVGRNRVIKELAIEQFARRSGFDQSWVDTEVARQRSKTHAAILERMLVDGNDDLAKAYDKKWNKEIQQDELNYLTKVRKETKESQAEAYAGKERDWFLMSLPDGQRPQNMPKLGYDEMLTLLASGEMKLPTFKTLKSSLFDVNDDETKPMDERTEKQHELEYMFKNILGGEVTAKGSPTGPISLSKDATRERITEFRNKVMEYKWSIPKELQKEYLLQTNEANLATQPEKMAMFSSLLSSLDAMRSNNAWRRGDLANIRVGITRDALSIFDTTIPIQKAYEKVALLKEKAQIAANPNKTRFEKDKIYISPVTGEKCRVTGWAENGNPIFEVVK